MTTLRDRKKERTRQALIDAAGRLFAEQGYERTTVADIAAAADIGTRTFFSYFASKEELVYPEADARIRAAVDAIAARAPGDSPVDVLLRALGNVGDEIVGPMAGLRLRLAQTVPAVRGRGLQIQADAQREIAGHLRDAFPDQLDAVSAAALVGAFIGAVAGALQVLLDDPAAVAAGPAELRERMRAATDIALRPWAG